MFVPQKRIRTVCATVLPSLIAWCGSILADEVVLPAEVPPADVPPLTAPMQLPSADASSADAPAVTAPMELPPANASSSGAPAVTAPMELPSADAPIDLPPVESDPPLPIDAGNRIFSSGPMDGATPPSIPVPLEPARETAGELKTVEISSTESQCMPQSVYQPHASCACWQQKYTRRWLSFETLLWWTSGSDLPVVATTSPPGTAADQAGILAPGMDTQVLFGGHELFDFFQGGFRLRGGRWFNDCDGSGLSAEFLMLAPRGENFVAQSNGTPTIARPFLNAGTVPYQPDAELVAFPGLSNGTFRLTSDTNMYSVGVHYLQELFESGCCCNGCGECNHSGCGSCGENCDEGSGRLGIMVGPRFSHLNDSVAMDESFTGVASGNQFRLADRFSTENSFLGGEFGLRARRERGDLSLDLGLQLAVGLTRQELDITGFNSTTNALGTTTASGGFYAQDSNIGRYERTRLSLIPALEVALGWELNRGWRFTAGYNFMFWSNVLRAAEEIDTVINEDFFAPPVTPSAGGNRPVVSYHETDYFAHGISIGFERRW